MLNDDKNTALKSIKDEYKTKIECDKFRNFQSPEYTMKYKVNGMEYVSYRSLEGKTIERLKEKYGCDCGRIMLYKGKYDNNVVLLVHERPCFDSSDRMYDQYHLL